jgi:hypothetical protein
MKRWPPILWLPVYVASVLILMGSRGKWPLLVVGGVLAVIALGLALRLAVGRSTGRPRPAWFPWALGGLAAWYLVAAAAAALAEPVYAVATLLAGVIPMTALALLLATMRAKTVESEGRLHDAAAADADDPFPGIGVDDASEMGDTPELAEGAERSGDMTPERRFERSGGETADRGRGDRSVERRASRRGRSKTGR